MLSRNIKIISLSVFLAFYSSMVFAGNDSDEEIPPWMENVVINGKQKSTYLVPKGAKRKIIGSQVIVENPNEYTARRVYELEEFVKIRLQEIEKENEQFKEDIDHLKKMIDELKKEVGAKQVPEK